jgi:hypothetical protein
MDTCILTRLKRLGFNVYGISPFRPGFSSLKPAFRWKRLQRSKSANYLAFPRHQRKVEELCCQPLHSGILISSERLQRIIDFQESSILEAERYYRNLSNKEEKGRCVFRNCQDIASNVQMIDEHR